MTHNKDVVATTVVKPVATTVVKPLVGNAASSNTKPPRPTGGHCAHPNAQLKKILMAHSEPAALPEPWNFFAPTKWIRQLRCQPAELMLALQQTVALKELVSTRILLRASNGQAILSPVLSDQKFQMLFDKDQNLIEVVSAHGAMLSEDPPCFEWGLRRHAANKGPLRVYLASSVDEVQVLRRLEFTATTAAGLANLNAEQVRRLIDSNVTPFSNPSHRLVIVGWNVGTLVRDVPAQAEQILHRIWDIACLFNYGTWQIYFDFWRPSADDLEQIRAAISFRDRGVVRNAFKRSIEASMTSAVDAWNAHLERSEVDLDTAYKELKRVISSSGFLPNSKEAQIAVDRYSRAIDKATSKKFLEAADESQDPIVSSMLLVGQEAFDEWAADQSTVTSARQVINTQRPTATNSSSEKKFLQRRQLVDLLDKIRKALGRNK